MTTTPIRTGRELAAWRRTHGLTQADVGRALGLYVSPRGGCSTLTRWESGAIPLSPRSRAQIAAYVAAHRAAPRAGR